MNAPRELELSWRAMGFRAMGSGSPGRPFAPGNVQIDVEPTGREIRIASSLARR